ncbi:polysaccharide deacetylase family protein [Rhizobium grahamii]|uniref:Chitooligosaccharide deacetylase n=1 Tax=Rhizobium grahamii CCGE 502 TaxID=990285 RepID=S3I2L7_9HYPH|nr:polysaccharide deacetylase family protein [Rhizobium grahamii]EPE94013.1 polysaccharide deacetylase [Rhizobium grahamii CCGE 502]
MTVTALALKIREEERVLMIDNPLPWPNGARCAVAFTFDIDTDSFLHLLFGEKMPDMVAATSWARYDEIALPRLLRIYRDFGLKQTFFYPAWCMERYPHLVDAILKDGHEIAHHGYLHESMRHMPDRESEVEWIVRGVDVIEKMTGKKPRGFRAPNYHFSRHSASILAQLDFRYDSSLMDDDLPSLYQTSHGELLGLPSSGALDDWAQYVNNSEIGSVRSIRSPQEASKTFMADFEAAYRYGGMWIAVWHPWVSARPARAEAMCRMIEEMQIRGDVWITTMEAIADHVHGLIAREEWAPRRTKLPYYEEPLSVGEMPPQVG